VGQPAARRQQRLDGVGDVVLGDAMDALDLDAVHGDSRVERRARGGAR
jgi:hypothetical protein